MRASKPFASTPVACALLLALACASAAAQDLRPESLKLHGGVYSPDCTRADAPRVRIATDGLEIAHAGRAMRTPVRMDSYTSFGGAPTSPVPDGYRVEFIGDDFSLFVFEDARGQYVPLADYVPTAVEIVGPQVLRARFSRCTGG